MEVGHLTSITGHVEYDSYEVLDVDYVGLEILDGTNQTEKYDQWSQEIRYTSPGGEDVDYIIGAYFQTADVDVTDYVPFGFFSCPCRSSSFLISGNKLG